MTRDRIRGNLCQFFSDLVNCLKSRSVVTLVFALPRVLGVPRERIGRHFIGDDILNSKHLVLSEVGFACKHPQHVESDSTQKVAARIYNTISVIVCVQHEVVGIIAKLEHVPEDDPQA